MKPFRILMLLGAWVVLAGLVMHWTGTAYAGWVIGGALGVLGFVCLLIVIHARWREPPDAPERRARWME